MKLSAIIEGLQILAPYYEGDGYHTGAEHDVIYAYCTERPLPETAVKRLVELGWYQPEVEVGDDEFESRHYDPSECWSAFT